MIVDHDPGDEDEPDRLRMAPEVRQRIADAGTGRWTPPGPSERLRTLAKQWGSVMQRLADG